MSVLPFADDLAAGRIVAEPGRLIVVVIVRQSEARLPSFVATATGKDWRTISISSTER